MGKEIHSKHDLTEQKYKCAHCGIETLLFIISEGTHIVTYDDYGYDAITLTNEYKLFLCPACYGVNVIRITYDSEHMDEINDAEENYYHWETQYLYPQTKSDRFKNLPKEVAIPYKNAEQLKKINPVASVIFSRKSLESICEDLGASGRNLEQKIESLAQQRAIPDSLKVAAHSIRLIGNGGAHKGAGITEEDAEILLKLCDAIIVYIYEAPELISRIQQKVANLNKTK